jgi:hypothetical protein
MNIIQRATGFVQSLWNLSKRTAWDWRHCPKCGETLTCRWGTYTRHPWSLEGRKAVVVQRHWCYRCQSSYSEESAWLVRRSWYSREVHRFSLDLWSALGGVGARFVGRPSSPARSLVARSVGPSGGLSTPSQPRPRSAVSAQARSIAGWTWLVKRRRRRSRDSSRGSGVRDRSAPMGSGRSCAVARSGWSSCWSTARLGCSTRQSWSREKRARSPGRGCSLERSERACRSSPPEAGGG